MHPSWGDSDVGFVPFPVDRRTIHLGKGLPNGLQ